MTGPDFIEALAPVTGMHTSTLVRYFQEMRQAGLIPTSGKGGGKWAVHFDATDAATVLLGLCARKPGLAEQTARMAMVLPCAGTEEPSPLLITELTETILAGQIADGWSMVLNPNPLSAKITDAAGSTKLFWRGPGFFIPGSRRHITVCSHVYGDVLAALAKLVGGAAEGAPA